MSSNPLYRVLAWIGIVTGLGFGIILAVFFGTRNSYLVIVAGVLAVITLLIWIFLYFVKRRFDKNDEIKKFLEQADNSNEKDESGESVAEEGNSEKADAVGEVE